MDSRQPTVDEMRAIADADFNCAKRCWAYTLSLKAGAVAATFGAALAGWNAVVAVAVLAILAEVYQWRSDVHRSDGESLQRKIDFHDALGWPISDKDQTDAVVRHGGAQGTRPGYFSSQEPPGVKRALQNLVESAWYSRNQLAIMARLCTVLVTFSLVASLLVLIGLTQYMPENPTALTIAGRAAAAVISLVVSIGLLKTTVGCYNARLKVEKYETDADALLGKDAATDIEAIRIWQEYHLVRAAAPIIPAAVWNTYEKSLNGLWAKRSASWHERPPS